MPLRSLLMDLNMVSAPKWVFLQIKFMPRPGRAGRFDRKNMLSLVTVRFVIGKGSEQGCFGGWFVRIGLYGGTFDPSGAYSRGGNCAAAPSACRVHMIRQQAQPPRSAANLK